MSKNRLVYRDKLEILHEASKEERHPEEHRRQLIQAVCILGLILLDQKEE